MELQQLKRQLQRELLQQQGKKSKNKRWILVSGLLLLLGAATGAWFYLQPQPHLAQKLLEKCIKLEANGQLAAAEACYSSIHSDYPSAEQAATALFSIGKIRQYDLQKYKLALLSYLQLEHDYPTSVLVLPAREEAARIVKYRQRDYSRAIEFYQRLLELDNGTPDQYYYEIADCYFRLENFSQARIELETLLTNYPSSSLAAEALYRQGAILVLEGDHAAARQAWQQLVEGYPDSRHRQAAEFDLAKLLEEEEFLKEALLLYQQINESNKSPILQEKIDHLQQRIAAKKEAI